MPGYDIYHRKKRVVTIEGGAGTADKFDPLDQVDVKDKVVADKRRIIKVLVGPVAVNEDEYAGVVPPRPVYATNPQVGVIPVISGEETPLAADDIRQIALAVPLDFIGSNNAY
jgi:hypothetical protein